MSSDFIEETYRLETFDASASKLQIPANIYEKNLSNQNFGTRGLQIANALKQNIKKPIDLKHWGSQNPTVRCPLVSMVETYRFET